jgi:hypothetical protein
LDLSPPGIGEKISKSYLKRQKRKKREMRRKQKKRKDKKKMGGSARQIYGSILLQTA